jgi:succinoglycan biosynthesis protein ExoA
MAEYQDPSSAEKGLQVLVAIPCLNEEKYLERLVTYLVADCTGIPAHIVIIDGGSTDRSVEIAEGLSRSYSNVTLLKNPKRIQSAAFNLAIASLGGDADTMIRVDAHADYPSGYCKTLLEEAAATGADSVVVAMNTVGTAGFQRAVAAAQNSKLGNGGSAHRSAGTDGKWVDHGHHALIRLDAFLAVGGYDETFSHNEDAELDIRLVRGGFKIWLTGKTVLTYYPRSAPWPLFLQYFRYGQGRARTLAKHRILPKLRQMIPAAVVPAVVLAFLAPVWLPAAMPLAAWAFLCLSYGGLLGIKAKDREIAALSGVAAMLMHLAWSLGFWAVAPKAFQTGKGSVSGKSFGSY